MDIKQLHTFLVLSQLLSYTKTAQQLNYAQSSVTFQIQQLESELHVRLFEQIGKRIFLSQAGEALLPYANQIVHTSDELYSYFSEFQTERLIVGSSESLSTYLLPSVLKNLKDLNATADLYLKIIDTSEFITSIKEHVIDIGLTLDTMITDPAIKVLAYRKESLGLYCAADYPLSSDVIIRDESLKNIPMIVTGRTCPYRMAWENCLREKSIVPKTILETSSVPAIKQNTLSGLGVCILPKCTVLKELETGELRELNYQISACIYSQLLIHKDKIPNTLSKQFIDLMISCLTSF